MVSLQSANRTCGMAVRTSGPAPPGLSANAARLSASALEILEERNHVADLVRSKPELGHVRMSGNDALRQRLLERLDRIALVQGAERWRNGEGARSDLVDGMTHAAVDARECAAPLDPGRGLRHRRIGACTDRHRGDGEERKNTAPTHSALLLLRWCPTAE